jgi:hypothetical protein
MLLAEGDATRGRSRKGLEFKRHSSGSRPYGTESLIPTGHVLNVVVHGRVRTLKGVLWPVEAEAGPQGKAGRILRVNISFSY